MFVYLAQEDVGVAKKFLADFSSKLEWIARTGFTGVPRDRIRPGLRALPYRERCINFRVDESTVTILRVLHGRQDINSQHF